MSKAGGSKADTAVKIAIVFFISLLSFTTGTFVGSKFEESKARYAQLENQNIENEAVAEVADASTSPISDEDIEGLEDFVKASESETAGREVASAETHAAADSHSQSEKAHEKDGYAHLKKSPTTEVMDAHPKSAAAHSKETHAKVAEKAAQPEASAKPHATEKAAERLAQDKAPTAEVKKAPRQPSNTLPAVATSVVGKYTVQVASYATEAEARTHATRLHDKGFNAFYIPAEVSGKTWYRVSIGRFDDQKSAMAHRKEVIDSQAATSAIVQKILK